ncbi:MAG: acetyl-CoA acetyltransferase, partial [Caulobacteraceae bacterium]
LTKQSVGVYSTAKPKTRFSRQDPSVIQRRVDALAHPDVIEQPQGPAKIETFTVVHAREGYRMGIVIGRDAEDRRFVANTPADPKLLAQMEESEQVGRRGEVRLGEDGVHNHFMPA